MKDSRKLSVVYFAISLVMLLMVCFGCESNHLTDVNYNDAFLTYEIVEYKGDTVVIVEIKDFVEDDYISLLTYIEQMMENKGYDSYIIRYNGINGNGIVEIENGTAIEQSK